jgi:hypothetical protein
MKCSVIVRTRFLRRKVGRSSERCVLLGEMTMTRRTLRRWCVAFDRPRSFFLRFDVLTLDLAALAERDADGGGAPASSAAGQTR